MVSKWKIQKNPKTIWDKMVILSWCPVSFVITDRTSRTVSQTRWGLCFIQVSHMAKNSYFSEDPYILFFQNKFVLSHFHFALFVLEKICWANTKLQKKHIFLPHAWVLVKNLKEEFFRYSEEIRTMSFSSFDYLANLSMEQIGTFRVIVDTFLLNMDIRFPCPSFSMVVRIAKKHIEPSSNKINPAYMSDFRQKCPLFEMEEIFIFRMTSFERDLLIGCSSMENIMKFHWLPVRFWRTNMDLQTSSIPKQAGKQNHSTS